MLEWIRRYEVLSLGLEVLTPLIATSLLGLIADRMLDTWPWGILTGALVGVFFATIRLMRNIQRRYEMLAPTDAEEEHP